MQHTNNVRPAEAGLYVLMLNADGSADVEFLPASATTALIDHAIRDEALLMASVLVVFVGRNDEGPAATEAEAASRLRALVRHVWAGAAADGDPDYMEWAAALGRHDDVDWRVFAQFVAGAALSACTREQAPATLAVFQLQRSDDCAGLSGVSAR